MAPACVRCSALCCVCTCERRLPGAGASDIFHSTLKKTAGAVRHGVIEGGSGVGGPSSAPARVARASADETRLRILEAAEALFAERGYYGVTVREIARAVGVDPALVNYHFGGKGELLAKALLSRAHEFMVEREAALEACIRAADGRPSFRDIIVAYTRPYLVNSQSKVTGWKHWFKLLAKVNTSPEWAPSVFRDYFDPFVRKFIEALKLAAPGAQEEKYYWCYQYFSGALVLIFAETGRLDDLSNGLCRSGDLAGGYDLFVPFFVSGFEAILGPGGPPAPEPV